MKPTIIPAHPGFYVAEPSYTLDEPEATGIALIPIIAWEIAYEEEGKQQYPEVRPITPQGRAEMNNQELIKRPDGTFSPQYRMEETYTSSEVLRYFREQESGKRNRGL